jgi:hypothetical protein
MSGAVNVVAGPFSGLQAAGGFNFALEARGAQMSGGANVAGRLRGIQLAGGANVATTVTGAQIAPVNVAAGDVHGVQIGIVNVAKNADFALGLVNIATEGRFHVEAWGMPDSGLLFAGVKNGGAHYHSIYGIGLRPTDAHRAWAALGFGVHATPFDSVFVDVDAIAHSEIVFDSASRNVLYQARAVVGYRAVRGFSVFAGPTYDVLDAHVGAPSGVAPGYSTQLARNSSDQYRGWPGVALGVEGF